MNNITTLPSTYNNVKNEIGQIGSDLLKIMYPVMLGASFSILMSTSKLLDKAYIAHFLIIYMLIISDYFFSFFWIEKVLLILKGNWFTTIMFLTFSSIFTLGMLMNFTKLLYDNKSLTPVLYQTPNFWFLTYLFILSFYGFLIYCWIKKKSNDYRKIKIDAWDWTEFDREWEDSLKNSLYPKLAAIVAAFLLLGMNFFYEKELSFGIVILYIAFNAYQNIHYFKRHNLILKFVEVLKNETL